MLELKELSFRYPRLKQLFSRLNLSLEQGAICGLLGENGSGKTTLLKILAGMIFPSSGSCHILGHDPANREPSFLQEMFFLPEDIYVPPISGKQYTHLYASFYPRFNDQLLEKILKDFDIDSEKMLPDLSHGQKKKFLIAFALATDCKLLIMDEPTNGLDIPSKTQFRKAIASAISKDKLFIISTHQVHDVENLVDTVVMIDDGNIIFNQNIGNITKKLSFMNSIEKPSLTKSIYFEKHITGYKVIVMNEQEQDTEIDLELLFKAILMNREMIKNIFTGESSHE